MLIIAAINIILFKFSSGFLRLSDILVTPLGHKEVVLLLLESKSNIDHQTKTGCTPLMEATRFVAPCI